jgi:hypothetical protein
MNRRLMTIAQLTAELYAFLIARRSALSSIQNGDTAFYMNHITREITYRCAELADTLKKCPVPEITSEHIGFLCTTSEEFTLSQECQMELESLVNAIRREL